MIDRLVALVLDESKWMTASMGVALLVVAGLIYRQRRSDLAARRLVLSAMSLYFGVTIGLMAFGHLLAVTIRLAMRNLDGPIPLLYAIGIALAVPSWWLIYDTARVVQPADHHGRVTLRLNAWLAVTLLVLGVHNLPLAALGILNVAYQQHSARGVGWGIVVAAVAVNVGLFVGSVIFLASGQSFEQFRGLP